MAVSLSFPAVCGGKEVGADEEESTSAFYLCGHCTVHFLRKSAMTARLVPERSLAQNF
jgi:hypothetical protein